jgi:hypothetical protein
MNSNSNVVFAGRLLVNVVDSFSDPSGDSKRELARTLNSISIYLAEIAAALRLGDSPNRMACLLRAKTITFIIVAREVVPELTAREIARQLVSSTRFLTAFNHRQVPSGVASDFEDAARLFKSVAEQLAWTGG